MAQQADQLQVTINYGCTETHVLMQFSQPVTMNMMTIEQAEAMREQLGNAIKLLKDRMAGKPVTGSPMPPPAANQH